MDQLFSILSSGTRFKKKANSKNNNIQSIDLLSSSSTINSSKEQSTNHLESTDEINEFRNKMMIKVRGSDIPPPAPKFEDLDICREMKSTILRNIEESDWKEPTPIQMQAIPIMLNGHDILAAAPTGSGKTAAYLIPVLSMLRSHQAGGVRGLILVPTRELADQIYRESLRLSAGRKLKICLLKKTTAASALANLGTDAFSTVDLLISTPMRLVSLIRAKAVSLACVRVAVLDEADKLFEMSSSSSRPISKDTSADTEGEEAANDGPTGSSSFLGQVDEILAECTYTGGGSDRSDGAPCMQLQRALFSATIGPFVQELAAGFLRNNAVQLTIGTTNAGASTIRQELKFVGREEGKLIAVRQLIQEGRFTPPILIFLQNVERAKELFRELVYDGISVEVMHAERTQAQREDIIQRFRVGDIWVLICTDLMARGIDFVGVRLVINYDLPTSPVSYIHRIGRTGRAGRQGEAITLFTESDMANLRSIANVMRLSGCDVPEWILSIKQLSTKQKRKLKFQAPDRRNISTSSSYDKKKMAHKKQIVNQSIEKKKRARSTTTESDKHITSSNKKRKA